MGPASISNEVMTRSILHLLVALLALAPGCDQAPRTLQEGDIPAPPDQARPIVLLLYDGFTALDAIGPLQFLGLLEDVRIVTVAKERGAVTSDNGIVLVAERALHEVDSAYILLVPGGLVETLQAAHDTSIQGWVRRIDRTTTWTASVCTGAWILAASGVLKDRPAATHWYGAEELERLGARYDSARVVVHDKFITSAGVSAGMDMGLTLVRLIAGDDYAKAVQLGLHYDPEPPMDHGSPEKCDSATVDMMQSMYDHALREAGLQRTEVDPH